MWNGILSPDIAKHRDFLHATFWDHIMNNGGNYSIDSVPVRVKYNPENDRLLSPSDLYFFVEIDFNHGQPPYEYLIHSESDLSEPNERTIKRSFNIQAKITVPGGRDWWDYLDFDDDDTRIHPRVVRRLEEGETLPVGPPKTPTNSFWDSIFR